MDREREQQAIKDKVAEYLALGEKFENPPQVKLKIVPHSVDDSPLDARGIAVSTAIQCYAPGQARMTQRDDEKSQNILESTKKAGHHTTQQHANYTFLLSCSRSVLHDIFHQHPFYNSEQQSQRYVRARSGEFLTPAGLTTEQARFFNEAAMYMNNAYDEFLSLLKGPIEEKLRELYRGKARENLPAKRDKIAQEVARYALPIGQLSVLYHTLNQLQIARLFRACEQRNFPDEARYIVARMIDEIGQHDETIYSVLSEPTDTIDALDVFEETSPEDIEDFRAEFDAELEEQNCILIEHTHNARGVLAKSVRVTRQKTKKSLPDDQAISSVLDPLKNRLLSDLYDIGMHVPFVHSLMHVTFTFGVKLSHTADSQRQRHRTTPGSTAPITLAYNGTPDYITPMLIAQNPEIKARYDVIMHTIFANVNKAIEMGIPREQALLLLPNALALRIVESGNLFNWIHRLRQRLCYLAQEEIFFISVQQAKAFLKVFPEGASLFLAPCGIRKRSGTSPFCPEGDRFCRVPVFNYILEQYEKHRLV